LVNKNRHDYKDRMSFHDAMQRDMTRLATKFNLKGKAEYKIHNPSGFLDVAWLNEDQELIIAFEIDSSIRANSVRKLAELPNDIERIWLCYSPKEIDIQSYEDIINGLVLKYEIKFQRKQVET